MKIHILTLLNNVYTIYIINSQICPSVFLSVHVSVSLIGCTQFGCLSHLYLYNNFTRLSVCLSVCSLWPPKRLGRFQKYFACGLPLRMGWFKKKKLLIGPKKNFFNFFFQAKIFFSGQKYFFQNFFDFFKIFNFFLKFQNSKKNFHAKNYFLEKKIWEKQICSWASEASHVYLEYIGCRRHPLCEYVRKYWNQPKPNWLRFT